MIGPFINAGAIIIGSVCGITVGKKVSERIREKLTMLFGLSSMGLGLVMVQETKLLPVVILSLLLGGIIGECINIEHGIHQVATKVKKLIERFTKPSAADLSHEVYMENFIACLILFCASGTGIFGAMQEGMTGDPIMLVVKSFLDLFTAGIFAISLGFPVAILAIPQLAVQAILYFAASTIQPLTTPDMIADFSGVGGLIMFATGLRICRIKSFSTGNMLPALFIVMPISYFWTMYILK